MAFHAKYTVPGTEREIIRSLSSRDLRRSLSRDKNTLIQWTKFNDTNWPRVLSGEIMSASFYVHSGLSRKAELFPALELAIKKRSDVLTLQQKAKEVVPTNTDHNKERIPQDTNDSRRKIIDSKNEKDISFCTDFTFLRDSLLDFHVIDSTPGPDTFVSDIFNFFSFSSNSGVWILKASCRNNAVAVHIIDSATVVKRDKNVLSLLMGLCRKTSGENTKNSSLKKTDKWLLQRHKILYLTILFKPKEEIFFTIHVPDPMLLNGCKFHLRVNVVAVGCLAIYVHGDPVAHVATKSFNNNWLDKAAHITNHCTQSGMPNFNSDVNTLGFDNLQKCIKTEFGDDLGSSLIHTMWDRIRNIIRETFLAFIGQKRKFYPMPNSYEVFGFDFMMNTSAQPFLLEINSGPGLEGHCHPTICTSVVNDTLKVTLDPVLKASKSIDINGIDVRDNTVIEQMIRNTSPQLKDTKLELLWEGNILKAAGPPVLYTSSFLRRVNACLRKEKSMKA